MVDKYCFNFDQSLRNDCGMERKGFLSNFTTSKFGNDDRATGKYCNKLWLKSIFVNEENVAQYSGSDGRDFISVFCNCKDSTPPPYDFALTSNALIEGFCSSFVAQYSADRYVL